MGSIARQRSALHRRPRRRGSVSILRGFGARGCFKALVRVSPPICRSQIRAAQTAISARICRASIATISLAWIAASAASSMLRLFDHCFADPDQVLEFFRIDRASCVLRERASSIATRHASSRLARASGEQPSEWSPPDPGRHGFVRKTAAPASSALR